MAVGKGGVEVYILAIHTLCRGPIAVGGKGECVHSGSTILCPDFTAGASVCSMGWSVHSGYTLLLMAIVGMSI